MAGSDRDVTLIIRARDEAGKAIASVSEALKTLAGVQDSTGQSAQKMDGLLGQLGSALSNLQREAEGLQALGTVAKQIERASAAVERLETQTASAGESVATLSTKYEQLAKAGGDLAERLGEAKGALEGQRSATAQAEADQARLTTAVNTASAAFRTSYNALRQAKEPNEALRQTYRDQRDGLIALIEQQLRGDQALTQQRASLVGAEAAYVALNREITANAGAQERLGRDVATANEKFDQSQATLEKARTELTGMVEAADGASKVLGGVAVNQAAVGEASKATAESIAQVTEAMKQQRSAGGTEGGASLGPAAGATAAYRAQIQAVKDARTEWVQAQAAAQNLGREIAKTEAPTREMQAAFILAKAASQQAEQSYQGQAAALSALKGVTQGGFAAFNQLANALETEARAAQDAARALNGLPNIAPQVKPITASIVELLGALFKIPGAAGEAAGGIRKVGDGSRQSLDLMQRLRGEVLGLTASYVGLYGAIHQIGEVVTSIAAVESAQARLSVVFDGNKKAASSEIQFLMAQAERLGIPFTELAASYTKVAIAGKEMNFSNESSRKIYISLAEAARVSGLTAEEMNGVYQGLAHAIDRGTINARNFNNQIAMRIPGSMKAISEAMDTTIAKFDAMQRASGGVMSTEETLVKFSEILRQEFSGALPESLNTVNAELGRFKTYIQEAQIAVGAGGFTDAFKGLIDDFGAMLKSDQGANAFKAIGEALAGMVNGLKFAADHFNDLIKVAKVFISLKVAGFVIGLVSANGALSVSLTKAAVDVGRLEAAFAALSLERLAAMWATFRTQITAAGASLSAMGVDGAIAATGAAVASAGLATLRGVMIGLTAVAETMWRAIGGLPGLLITGVTFVLSELLGRWITGVDQLTAAMDAQDRTLEKIKRDYSEAADAAQGLKTVLSDISTVQAEIQRTDIQEGLTRKKEEALSKLAALPADTASGKQAHALAEQFYAGKLSADQFKAAINALAAADPHLDRAIVAQLFKVADEARAAEASLRKADAILAVLHGTATQTQRVLLGLADAGNRVNSAFDPTKIDQYTAAIDKLRKLDPHAKVDLQADTAREEAQAAFKNSLESIKLNPNQIGAVSQGNFNIKDLSEAQLKLAKEAYQQYQDTLQGIAAEAAHALVQELPKTLSDNIVARIQYVEGFGKNSGSNGKSHAAGWGQFEPDTWIKLFDERFPKDAWQSRDAKLAYRSDKGTATEILKESITQNSAALAHAGKSIDDMSIYLAHFLGATGAIKMLSANPNASAASVDPSAAAANRSVFYHKDGTPVSVAQLESWASNKIGAGGKVTASGETKQEEFDAALGEFVQGLKDAAKAVAQGARDAFIASRVHEQESKAQSGGATFGPEQRAGVTSAAGALFDVQEAEREKKINAELILQLDAMRRGEHELTLEKYIAAEASQLNIVLDSEQGKIFVANTTATYNQIQQQKAYNNVLGLAGQRKALVGELNNAFKEGDQQQVAELQKKIADITKDLLAALPAARAFVATMGDQKMGAALERVIKDLASTKVGLTDWRQINQSIAQGLTGAFHTSGQALGKFVSGVGSLGDVLKSVRDSFLQFAADFLMHIAEMIVQQQLLNMLQSTPIIGKWISDAVNMAAGAAASTAAATGQITTSAAEAGAAAFADSASLGPAGLAAAPAAGLAASALVTGTYLPMIMGAALKHAGGIVGAAGGQNRNVAAEVFRAAREMHNGGIVGLLPNEIPTILKRNEEVLTEADPRHAFNGGGQAGAAPAARPQDIKIVNAFDHAEVLSEALNTRAGQMAVINFVRQNPRAVNNALKGGGG